MEAETFEEGDFFAALAESGARVLLIGRALIAVGLPAREEAMTQLQVMICMLQTHDAQSPSLKQDCPETMGPGVHDGAPLLELELLLPVVMGGHMPPAMPPGFSH